MEPGKRKQDGQQAKVSPLEAAAAALEERRPKDFDLLLKMMSNEVDAHLQQVRLDLTTTQAVRSLKGRAWSDIDSCTLSSDFDFIFDRIACWGSQEFSQQYDFERSPRELEDVLLKVLHEHVAHSWGDGACYTMSEQRCGQYPSTYYTREHKVKLPLHHESPVETARGSLVSYLGKLQAAWRPAVLQAMWGPKQEQEEGQDSQEHKEQEQEDRWPTQDKAAASELVMQYLGKP